MDSLVIHTPLRHIGYHKSSKSQMNIFSSSPEIKRPTVIEVPYKKKKKNCINEINKLLEYLSEKEQEENVNDGFRLNDDSSDYISLLKENKELKINNNNLKAKISNLENHVLTINHSDLTGDNDYSYQSNNFKNDPNFMEAYNTNKELKGKNIKLKKKLKEVEYLLNSTNLHLVNLLDKKLDVENKMKTIMSKMGNFLTLLNQAKGNSQELISNEMIKENNNTNYSNSYSSEKINQRNFTNFSEAENLNTSTEGENENDSYKNEISEQSNQIEISLKQFEVNKNDSVVINSNDLKRNKKGEMGMSSKLSNSGSYFYGGKKQYQSSSYRQPNTFKTKKVTDNLIKTKVKSKKILSKTERKII